MFNGIGALSAKLQSQAQATTPQVLMEPIFHPGPISTLCKLVVIKLPKNDSDEVMRAACLTTHFLWVKLD